MHFSLLYQINNDQLLMFSRSTSPTSFTDSHHSSVRCFKATIYYLCLSLNLHFACLNIHLHHHPSSLSHHPLREQQEPCLDKPTVYQDEHAEAVNTLTFCTSRTLCMSLSSLLCDDRVKPASESLHNIQQ